MLAPVSASVSSTHPKISMRAYFLADTVIEAGFFSSVVNFDDELCCCTPHSPPLKSCFEQMSFGLALCALLWTARPFFFREVLLYRILFAAPPPAVFCSRLEVLPLHLLQGSPSSFNRRAQNFFQVLVFLRSRWDFSVASVQLECNEKLHFISSSPVSDNLFFVHSRVAD